MYDECIDAYIESISEKLTSKPIQPAAEFVRADRLPTTVPRTPHKARPFRRDEAAKQTLSAGNVASCAAACDGVGKETPQKWAHSLVTSLFSGERHDASYAHSLRSGMQATAVGRPKQEPKARIKNLLDIFKSLNDAQTAVTPPRPAFKKLEQCFGPRAAANSVASCSFTPSSELTGGGQPSLRVRLEKWNRSATKAGGHEPQGQVKQRSQQKISDLIAEKVYRFERREMLQAFY